MKFLFTIYAFSISFFSAAQSVGIGTNAPAPSAQLDVNSTSKGMLIPRMSTLQRDAIVSPATGLQIFNTDDQCTDLFDGNAWIKTCGLKITGIASDPVHSIANSWLRRADFSFNNRSGAVSFSIGSKGYLGTGQDASGYRKDFWCYDPAQNTWTQVSDFGGTGREFAIAFSIGAKGYVGTGADFTGFFTNDFWEYDPSLNVWTQKMDYPVFSKTGAVGFSIGTKGYLGTGNNGAGDTKDFYEYDPVANSWTQKADFGGPSRTYATGFSIGTKGYIGTGSGSNGFLKDFWEYDQTTNTWTQKADFTGFERYKATAFSIGSFGYIGTGWTSSATNDFWEYNPTTNIWTQKPDFGGVARAGATGFSIGNKGYIGTGLVNSTIKDLWEYMDNNVTGYAYSSNLTNTFSNSVSDGTWMLMNNTINNANDGNVGINSDIPAAKLEVSGAMKSNGFQNSAIIQGARLEWNKDGGSGRTYLLNQKGLGPGGIVLGEIDVNNNISPTLTLLPIGNVAVTGIMHRHTDSLYMGIPSNTSKTYTWNHNLGYKPVIMFVTEEHETNYGIPNMVEVSYMHNNDNTLTILATNLSQTYDAIARLRWIVVH